MNPSRMKLLLITSTYPTPSSPFQGVFNAQLMKVLATEHSIRVIAPIPWTEGPLRTQPEAPIQEANEPEVIHPTFYYPPKAFRWTYGWWYWFSIRSQFRKIIKDFNPDAVLGYWAHPDSFAAVRAAQFLEVPSVVMVGGTDIRILARSGRRRRAIRSVLMKANQVVTFSRDLSEHVVAMGLPEEKVHLLYRGVDTSVFFPGDRAESRQRIGYRSSDRILLWIGRLVEVKNPQMAIRVLVGLRTQFGDRITLAMIGEGPLRRELEKLSVELGVESLCQFHGAQPHAELPDWYRAANLTILTSLSEGVPNVLRESIACNVSFVATDVGGVREIADPEFDSLVPSGAIVPFQIAIGKQLEKPTVRPRPTNEHDLQALGRQLSSLLERL